MFKDYPLMNDNKGSIPLFYPHIPKSSFNAMKKVLSGRWIGQGPLVDKFELQFSKKFCSGLPSVAVGSGTDALHLAYLLAEIKKGDEIICPVFTCTATNIPLLYLGAKIKFADIDANTLNISIESIKKLITKKTKAIVFVNYGGLPCNLKELKKIAIKYKIKLIYSATSASLGNKGSDKNLSPYAFSKAKNLELLENLKKWFRFKYEVIYFYNVYGPYQICKGTMSTVIGIFEDHYKKKKALPVVKPGTQTRRFTHIDDTVNVCYLAWKKNLCRHYSIASKKTYSILEVAKMFNTKIKYLPKRLGERYASALTNKNLSNNIFRYYGKIKLSDYIKNLTSK